MTSLSKAMLKYFPFPLLALPLDMCCPVVFLYTSYAQRMLTVVFQLRHSYWRQSAAISAHCVHWMCEQSFSLAAHTQFFSPLCFLDMLGLFLLNQLTSLKSEINFQMFIKTHIHRQVCGTREGMLQFPFC